MAFKVKRSVTGIFCRCSLASDSEPLAEGQVHSECLRIHIAIDAYPDFAAHILFSSVPFAIAMEILCGNEMYRQRNTHCTRFVSIHQLTAANSCTIWSPRAYAAQLLMICFDTPHQHQWAVRR